MTRRQDRARARARHLEARYARTFARYWRLRRVATPVNRTERDVLFRRLGKLGNALAAMEAT